MHVSAKVCLGKIEQVHHIWVMSHLAYVQLRITRNIFPISLDFEIVRLTCILFKGSPLVF